jgi:protein-arginine kinase activator protein McsA
MVSGLDGQGFNMDECPGCGVRFETVSKGGLFGCPSCYSSFNRFAATVLANDSGAAKRQG